MSVVLADGRDVAEDFEEFVGLVRDMREAQKQYFRIRNARTLAAAKSIERAVDDAIDRRSGNGQSTLF
jgi:hypothetical protein